MSAGIRCDGCGKVTGLSLIRRIFINFRPTEFYCPSCLTEEQGREMP